MPSPWRKSDLRPPARRIRWSWMARRESTVDTCWNRSRDGEYQCLAWGTFREVKCHYRTGPFKTKTASSQVRAIWRTNIWYLFVAKAWCALKSSGSVPVYDRSKITYHIFIHMCSWSESYEEDLVLPASLLSNRRSWTPRPDVSKCPTWIDPHNPTLLQLCLWRLNFAYANQAKPVDQSCGRVLDGIPRLFRFRTDCFATVWFCHFEYPCKQCTI